MVQQSRRQSFVLLSRVDKLRQVRRKLSFKDTGHQNKAAELYRICFLCYTVSPQIVLFLPYLYKCVFTYLFYHKEYFVFSLRYQCGILHHLRCEICTRCAVCVPCRRHANTLRVFLPSCNNNIVDCVTLLILADYTLHCFDFSLWNLFMRQSIIGKSLRITYISLFSKLCMNLFFPICLSSSA